MNQLHRWKKKDRTGTHSFWYEGVKYTITSGMVIPVLVPESALGGAARHYECLDPIENPIDDSGNPRPALDSPDAKGPIIIPHGKSKTRFDIINPDNPDKPLNDKPLKKAEAQAALGKLVEESDKLALTVKEELKKELDGMNWDQLVEMMEKSEIEILDEYETEDDLRAAIITSMTEE